VSLPRPYDRSHPRPRRDTPAFDERDVRKDLADHVAPYTDITPPVPAPEEPCYDTRFESPAEVHHDRVGAKYRQGLDPNYLPDDYTQMPAPPEPERWPRPRPAPPERLPTYEDTVRAGRLTGPLWPRPAAPQDDPESPAEPPASPLLQEELPADAAWDQMAEQAFAGPAADAPSEQAPALDSLLNAELPPLPEPDDPIALANQAFDQQMHDAFHALPDPFVEPPGGFGGLEEAIMMEPPPDLYDPFGPGGMPFM
jgi:hypothetical protein